MKNLLINIMCLFCMYEGNAAMQLQSSAFKNNEQLPKKYTCSGENINPPLQWQQVPEGTKSFVLIVDDPDAPSPQHPRPEGPWVHWIVFNIPATTKNLDENASVETIGAVQGKTDSGKSVFHGACPPKGSGTHRYFFKLYALDTTLDLKTGASKQQVLNAMKDHILAQAELMGTYKRN